MEKSQNNFIKLVLFLLLLTLIIFNVFWELWLDPLVPGGSLYVLKVMPLFFLLYGTYKGDIYLLQWLSLVILFYVMEGIVRMMSDTTSISNILGLVEFVLSTGIFICSLAYLRPAKLAYKAKKKIIGNQMKKTLYDKLWDAHVVKESDDGTSLIYIDRQLLHEVTSPQAFEGLKLNNRMPWRIDANLAVVDHNIPTKNIQNGIDEPIAKLQVDTLRKNCEEFGITFFDVDDVRNGIVHVVGPEQGATLPGMTVVCGDSHTSTHGAIGALAFGIGTSEVEHVLSTQTLIKTKDKNMLIKVEGKLPKACTSKDLILYIIGQIGTAGGTGYAIEFAGSTIRNLSIESRLTICNMSIEAGARSGLVAVDDKTIEYFKDKPFAPKGEKWEEAVGYWKTLHSDEGAHFDKVINIDASKVVPQVTWGTSPEMVLGIEDSVPDPFAESDSTRSQGIARALEYMGLKPNQKIVDIKIDKVFIGSCTNSRIEDIRSAAEIVKGKTIASNIKLAMVVPGSGLVKEQAELEGLDKVFTDAGFEWRSPGCSMCLAMNNDRLSPLERCASTSNRNFEGRQGHGGRTHLVSPSMAAAAAIAGHFVDVRNFSSLNQDQ